MSEKIKICTECEGRGFKGGGYESVYHNQVHHIPVKKCTKCEGTGKVIEIIKKHLIPFNLDKVFEEEDITDILDNNFG